MPNKKQTVGAFKKVVRMSEIALINTKLGEVIDFSKMLNESSYGKLSADMSHALETHVRGKPVYDIGAGDLTLSYALLELGPATVVAVDKDIPDSSLRMDHPENIVIFKNTYVDFLDLMPDFEEDAVAFIAWPANHPMDGLLELVSRFNTVVYLGKNTDGSACAWPAFFRNMFFRPVLAHVPRQRNTLIVWGAEDRGLSRELLLEERAGSDQSKCYEFGDR